MSNPTERKVSHRSGCLCLNCEARREGEKLGQVLGQNIAKALNKAIAKANKKGRKTKSHRCLRCGAGPEWIE